MDFMGVTDHSEYVGVTRLANTPGSPVSKLPEAQPMIMTDPNDQAQQQRVFLYLLSLTSKPPIKAFMTPEVAGTGGEGKGKNTGQQNKLTQVTALCSSPGPP